MKTFCVLLLLSLLARVAGAHAVSNSYLELNVAGDRVTGAWRIAIRDLDAAMGLDANADRLVSDGELAERSEAALKYAFTRLELQAGGRSCSLAATGVSPKGSYLNIDWRSDCAPVDPLSLRYDLFFDHDRTHQGHLEVLGAPGRTHIFTAPERVLSLGEREARWHEAPLQYFAGGVWHILIGWDHILFLLTLLLGAVLRPREASGAAPSLRAAALRVGKMVTAFTAAHSITLSAAALGWLALPSRGVETAIALSVALAAANNVWPVVKERIWLLAFGFGLLHGFGFANILLELGLPPARLIASLIGFNLGVEAGQLGLVAVAFPLVFRVHRRGRLRAPMLRVGSALIGVVGLVWSLERGLDVDWTRAVARELTAPALASRCDAGLSTARTLSVALLEGAGEALSVEHRRALDLACEGQLEASAQAHDSLLRSFAAGTPPLSRGLVELTFADVELARGARARARELLEGAVERLRAGSGPALLGDALSRLGELQALDAQWGGAYRAYEEARRLHEIGEDRAALAKDLSRLGDARVSAADPEGARAHYERARSIYEDLGDVAGVAVQLENLAVAAQLSGDGAEAAKMYRRAIELHQGQGHAPQAALDMAALARIYLGSAQYSESRALYEEANRLEQRLERKRFLAKNHNQLGNLHRLQGELDAAEQSYTEGLRISEAAGESGEAAKICANLASIYAKRGQPERARAMYERSLALFEQIGSEAGARRVRHLLASVE